MPCSTGMRACRVSCLHRRLVEEYRDARDARNALREQGDDMRMEDDEFAAAHPPMLFKDWLIAHKEYRSEESMEAMEEQAHREALGR